MAKKYHVFTITNEDIDSAIKQAYKQLKDMSESDEEFKENKKLFNKTRKTIREHPKQQYKQIVDQAMQELEIMQAQFDGTFFHAVQIYMMSNGAKQPEKDAGMDM